MAKVQIKLNRNGVRSILKGVGQDKCVKIASRALSNLGEGYEMEERHYPERNGAVVRTTTYQANADNLRNNTLLKAIR
ncbi:MAG: hypothetical protein PHT76_11510 [Anaerostipes sp.]|nr:hypothetical protein [Anaerostipes sp.]